MLHILGQVCFIHGPFEERHYWFEGEKKNILNLDTTGGIIINESDVLLQVWNMESSGYLLDGQTKAEEKRSLDRSG